MSVPYEERQAEWVKKHDVKVGDRVRLIRAAPNEEDAWPNFWPRTANGWIGNILRVKYLDSPNIGCYNPDADDWFNFPNFVLEKVVERQDKEWTVSYGLKVKTGDPVLVRDGREDEWRFSLLSHVTTVKPAEFPYRTVAVGYRICIPYAATSALSEQRRTTRPLKNRQNPSSSSEPK